MEMSRIMISMAVLAGATAVGLGASVPSERGQLAREDYEALRAAIGMESRHRDLECESVRGLKRAQCQTEARAQEQVELAELEARFRRTLSATREATMARVRAQHDFDRARCLALGGYERDSCVVAAHAERARALMSMKDS